MLDMDTISYIEEPLAHRMKVERNLNFATLPNDEDDFGFSRKKTARDPMSHRIIEKRRRDRMNNCLADLSRLVPTNYLKKGRGRIEKTEIIEMAIKHLKHLQAHPCKDPGSCEVAKATEQDHKRQFRQGYQECMSETMKFMMEVEGSWIGDGVGIRLINHLQKHYDKLSGGLCYTQALNLMASEESKSTVHMEVDNHSSSCYQPESNSNSNMHAEHNHPVPYYENNRSSDASELKHESDTNGHPLHPSMDNQPTKVTSQLREMLQNPGLPKDTLRCTNGNINAPQSPQPQQITVVVPPPSSNDSLKNEDSCYNFKKNIKHRFNADLRHHTSSPTDSHLSDRMSLPDEDSSHHKMQAPDSSPLRPCHSVDDRLGHNGGPPPMLLCNSGSHAFSPYQAPPPHAVSELSVKIPERTAPSDSGVLSSSYGTQHWDSHVETGSSCGSNPSPPPNTARSSGSSSGYSTNGENNSGPTKLKQGAHSPALSPYSRTPDRMSNRSPSPLQPGVPIFALHPKGTFYIPLTIESSLLIPYMVGVDDLAPVLHPISICVNLSSHSVKVEKLNSNSSLHYRPQSSFLMEKFHDRFVYADRPVYYPCPNSPTKNGCV